MANPDPEILARYVTDEHVVFPIHPQTLTEAGSDPYVLLTLASGEKVSPVRVLPSSSTRTLYVDGHEVARDTLSAIESAGGDLHIGAGAKLKADSFFTGLIDDVRIFKRAISAPEIAALAQ